MSTALATMPQPSALAAMNVTDVRVLAENVAKSRLFKGFETVEAAFTLMMICQAEGIHPMLAMRRYDVIQGRPALKSDAMLADFMKGGGTIDWKQTDEKICEATFSAPGLAKPLTLKWTIEQAKAAGLAGKDNWKTYPRAMLRARVVSEGVRMAMPGVVAGIYTPEEISDFEERPALAPVPTTVTPIKAEPSKPLARTVVAVDEHGATLATGEPPHDPVTGEVDMITPSQMKTLATLTGKLGISTRAGKLEWCSAIAKRPLASSKDLTKVEASTLIETAMVDVASLERQPGSDDDMPDTDVRE